MTRFVFLAFLFLTVAGCAVRPTGVAPSKLFVPPTESDIAAITRNIWLYSEKLKYEMGMKLNDSSVCYDENRWTKIYLEYSLMRNADLCQARHILVDVVEGFLNQMNEGGNAGFNSDHIHLVLKFDSFFDYYVDLQNVGVVTLQNGVTTFYAGDAIQCDPICPHTRSEPYHLSYDIVNYQREGDELYGPKAPDPWNETGFYLSIDQVGPSSGKRK